MPIAQCPTPAKTKECLLKGLFTIDPVPSLMFDLWTLQWRCLDLYSWGVLVLKKVSFEVPGVLKKDNALHVPFFE